MFARHVTMQLKPNTRAEFTQTIENEILPLLKKQHGFQDEIVFVAPGSGTEGIAISLWDKKEDAETYLRGSYPEVLKALAQSGQNPTNSAVPAKAENATLPDNAKPSDKTAKPEMPNHDYSPEAFVVEQYRSRYRFENDGTGRKETVARVRVQSEAGVQQWGQIQVGYNSANERVEIAYVRVVKADGSVVKAGDDAVQDLSAPVEREAPVYTDYRQKHITVPGLRPGEVLEYDMVTVIHTPLAAGQFWAEYEFDKNNIMLDEELDVDVPADRPLKLKNKDGKDPKISEEHGRRIYQWTSSHLEREDDAKNKDKDKNKDKKKKKKKAEEERPDVQLTTFVSWEQIGRWYAGLDKDRRAPSPEVRAKADELTKGLDTQLDKVQALYDFVAKNFRYVSLSLGLGRYQPHAAGDVLHNQYGDCKDKHTLLSAMLRAEGIQSYPVLIHSARKLDPDVPSPAQFDHVITAARLGSGPALTWLDTTTEVAPYGLILFQLRNKEAVLAAEDGDGGLQRTPADSPVKSSARFTIDGKFSEFGALDATLEYTTQGDREVPIRAGFRQVPQARWKEFVKILSTGWGFPGDVDQVRVDPIEDTSKPFHLKYHLHEDRYFAVPSSSANFRPISGLIACPVNTCCRLCTIGLGLIAVSPEACAEPQPRSLSTSPASTP